MCEKLPILIPKMVGRSMHVIPPKGSSHTEAFLLAVFFNPQTEKFIPRGKRIPRKRTSRLKEKEKLEEDIPSFLER